MKSIGDQIREFRERSGWNTTQMADAVGTKRQNIEQVEAVGNRIPKYIGELAQVMGKSVDDLLAEAGMSRSRPSARSTNNKSHESSDELVINQYHAGGAMGNGGLVLEDKPPGLIKSWRVDHEWLRLNVRHHTGIDNLRIVTGFGPSMRGMFNPGDPLLVDCGVTTVEVDAVYYFRVGDHGFIKMLQRIPTADGLVIRAKSKNPDYDPFDITPKMLGQDGYFQVFGKVLTVWRSEVL